MRFKDQTEIANERIFLEKSIIIATYDSNRNHDSNFLVSFMVLF